MTYDFDQIIPRNHTNSLKYDFAKERGKPYGLLPMWVADMDFQTPLAVREALVITGRLIHTHPSVLQASCSRSAH